MAHQWRAHTALAEDSFISFKRNEAVEYRVGAMIYLTSE